MARRILVVEDEAPIREMVCFVLEQNGFQPVEAEDYDSAVNQLNEPRLRYPVHQTPQARVDDPGYSSGDVDRQRGRRRSRARP